MNHNRGFLTSYPGAIGLKTGFTDQAGRTLITAARRDGRTLIAVVMGTWDDTGWAGYLLDQGFAGTATGGATPVTLPPVRVVPLDSRVNAFTALPHVCPAASTEGATAKPRSPAAAKATAVPRRRRNPPADRKLLNAGGTGRGRGASSMRDHARRSSRASA